MIPLLVPEALSGPVQRLCGGDPVMAASWATEVDCTSAIAHRQRLGQGAPAVHDLRTADALQLAAAVYVAEARPSTLEFVSLDHRLLAAARREGFAATKPSP